MGKLGYVFNVAIRILDTKHMHSSTIFKLQNIHLCRWYSGSTYLNKHFK